MPSVVSRFRKTRRRTTNGRIKLRTTSISTRRSEAGADGGAEGAAVLQLQCPDEFRAATEDQFVVWVDPLDGTSEYTQGNLDHVTVRSSTQSNSIYEHLNCLSGVTPQSFFQCVKKPCDSVFQKSKKTSLECDPVIIEDGLSYQVHVFIFPSGASILVPENICILGVVEFFKKENQNHCMAYVSTAVRKVYPILVFSVFNCEKTNGADSFFPPM